MTNAELAQLARGYADRCPRGSTARRTWLCVAVCLSTSSSLRGARAALDDIEQDDIRHGAEQLLRQITRTRATPD